MHMACHCSCWVPKRQGRVGYGGRPRIRIVSNGSYLIFLRGSPAPGDTLYPCLFDPPGGSNTSARFDPPKPPGQGDRTSPRFDPPSPPARGIERAPVRSPEPPVNPGLNLEGEKIGQCARSALPSVRRAGARFCCNTSTNIGTWFRRGESAAFDRIRTATSRNTNGHSSRSPTSQPLRARSQLRGRCARMFRARIARQDRAGCATLAAKSRLAPTASGAAPRDRSAIAQRVGAPAQTRARAAATRCRAWLQSALPDAEHRPRSRGASHVVPLVMPIPVARLIMMPRSVGA